MAATRRKKHGERAHPAPPGVRLTGRLWIERDGETLVSWARVELLERVRERGSILKAAKSMGMGYRHAWELLDDMNRRSARPLVERVTGGAGGGGTRLTPDGERVVSEFRALVDRFKAFLAAEERALGPVTDAMCTGGTHEGT